MIDALTGRDHRIECLDKWASMRQIWAGGYLGAGLWQCDCADCKIPSGQDRSIEIKTAKPEEPEPDASGNIYYPMEYYFNFLGSSTESCMKKINSAFRSMHARRMPTSTADGARTRRFPKDTNDFKGTSKGCYFQIQWWRTGVQSSPHLYSASRSENRDQIDLSTGAQTSKGQSGIGWSMRYPKRPSTTREKI